MTNNNYTQENCQKMSNQELVDIITNLKIHPIKLNQYLRNHLTQVYFEICERTNFLGNNPSIHTRIYCLTNNITEIPICANPNCKNQVTWNKHSFHKHCSQKCVHSNNDILEKIRNTCNERYGGIGFASNELSKKSHDQIKKTYGFEFASQSDDIKNKVKQTCIERFGVEYALQSNIVREKSKQTMLNRYGSEYTLQSTELRTKIAQTNIKNRGVVNPMQDKRVQDRVKQTCIEKYGVENVFQSEIIQDKIKMICMNKFNQESFMSTQEFKEKSKETMNQLYGVEYYAQSFEYHKTKKHKFESSKYPTNLFDSTWEVKIFEFCKDNGIDIEYSPSVSLSYEYDGKIFTYHPDFLINGKLYEVKGDQFFRFNESTGKEEMYCPYRNPNLSNEEYAWICGKYEAKHQCMLKNNVLILRNQNIMNLTIDIFN